MNENEAYHADVRRIGKSGLDLIAKCPALYYAKYLDPNRPKNDDTEAFVTGSAWHCLTLEEHKFASEFAVSPSFSGEGSKARKEEFKALNEGRKIITMEQYDTIRRMRDSVWRHPLTKELLTDIVVEQRIDWTEPITGALCKAKPDARNVRNGLIVDLKSTRDASPEGFAKSAWTYRYHVQSAFYMDAALSEGMSPKGFVFIAVEKTYPYLVGMYYATHEMLAIGAAIYRENLETYSECLRTGEWPGYSQIISPLSVPRWAQK